MLLAAGRICAALAMNKPLPRRPYVSRELPVHVSVLEYLRLMFPKHMIHHSPNGFGVKLPATVPERVRVIVYAAIAKAMSLAKHMGTVSGWPDIEVITVPPMFFEVKPEGEYPSPEQKAVGAALQAAGAHWAVVRSTDDVAECLRE